MKTFKNLIKDLLIYLSIIASLYLIINLFIQLITVTSGLDNHLNFLESSYIAMFLSVIISIVITEKERNNIKNYAINIKEIKSIEATKIIMACTIIFTIVKITNQESPNYQIKPREIIFFLLIIPTYEELMFRGKILTLLNEKMGQFFSSIINSALFTLMHTNHDIWMLVAIFIISNVNCMFRFTTNSVIPCIIIHGTFNFSIIYTGST